MSTDSGCYKHGYLDNMIEFMIFLVFTKTVISNYAIMGYKELSYFNNWLHRPIRNDVLWTYPFYLCIYSIYIYIYIYIRCCWVHYNIVLLHQLIQRFLYNTFFENNTSCHLHSLTSRTWYGNALIFPLSCKHK